MTRSLEPQLKTSELIILLKEKILEIREFLKYYFGFFTFLMAGHALLFVRWLDVKSAEREPSIDVDFFPVGGLVLVAFLLTIALMARGYRDRFAADLSALHNSLADASRRENGDEATATSDGRPTVDPNELLWFKSNLYPVNMSVNYVLGLAVPVLALGWIIALWMY